MDRGETILWNNSAVTVFSHCSLRIVLAVVVGGIIPCFAQEIQEILPEYRVKARMLRLIASYTTWPPGSAANDHGKPFVLGVIGESPFEHHLDEQFRNEPYKTKIVQVRYLSEPDDISGLDMLFIVGSQARKLTTILQRVKGKPILTVGDTPGFARNGVMVNFYVEGKKVKFEVNLDATRAEQITISSHLLKFTRIVK